MNEPLPTGKTLGQRLREIRTKWPRGKISQEALSNELGIPVITYMKMEQGHTKNPSFLTVWKVCRALGYSLDEFVEGVEANN
jgi:transcriptional regulator with XRE-family HTH domain